MLIRPKDTKGQECTDLQPFMVQTRLITARYKGPMASRTSWDILLSQPKKNQKKQTSQAIKTIFIKSWLSILVWEHLSSLQRMKQDCLSAKTTSISTVPWQNISFERMLGLATSEPELIKILVESLPSTISKQTRIQHLFLTVAPASTQCNSSRLVQTHLPLIAVCCIRATIY